LRWLQFRLQIGSKVDEYDGIALADLRRRSGHFRSTLVGAMQLLQTTDPRRYARVKREIDWIVNCTLEMPGAEYDGEFRICRVDFEEPTPSSDPQFSVGWWARTLVHEATHGVVRGWGIVYDADRRARIEQLCVTEENRFVNRLSFTHPELAADLHRDFSAAEWQFSWEATPRQRISSLFRRLRNQ
jgi:hypothetical protein